MRLTSTALAVLTLTVGAPDAQAAAHGVKAAPAPIVASGAPMRFLDSVYDAFIDDRLEDVSRSSHRDRDRVYSAAIINLWEEAERRAAPDPVVDFMPLAGGGQDIGDDPRFKVTPLSVGSRTARAQVTLMDGPADVHPLRLTISLVREANGWRIADIIGAPSIPSFAGLLRQDVARSRKRR